MAEIERQRTRHQHEASLLRNEHVAALTRTHQLTDESKHIATKKQELQNQIEHLQTQYEAVIQKCNQLTATLQQKEQEHLDHMKQDRQRQTQVVGNAKHRLRCSSTQIRGTFYELRNQTTEHLRALQGQITDYNTQLNKLVTHVHSNPGRVMELAKVETFDLWVQKQPDS